MKKLLIIFAVATLVLTSCEKQNPSPQKKMEKTFKLSIKPATQNSSTGFSRAGTVPMGRPIFILNSVDTMKITAETAAHGGVPSESIYKFLDDGSEAGNISIDTYLGENLVKVATTGFVETPYQDPQGGECDGVNTGGDLNEWPFDGLETTSTEIRDALRLTRPYFVFTGEKKQTITENPATQEMTIDLYTNNARLIATAEFENAPGAPFLQSYYAKLSFKALGGTAPTRVFGLSETYPIAWLHWSNKECIAGAVAEITVKLYDKATNALLWTKKLNNTPEYLSLLTMKGGVDQYIKIVISKESVAAVASPLTFNFHISEDESDITLK